jgi:hypothetical protein
MITGGKITYVEAKRDKEGLVDGLNINVGVDDVTVKGDTITVQYTFIANYENNIGHLKMNGVLYVSEDKSKAKEIEDTWKKSKKLPDDFAELVLNTITYTCGVNGTFAVQPVRLSPPMQMPLVRVGSPPEKAEKGAEEKKKKGAA